MVNVLIKRSGFTLIELMVTVAILSIVATLSLPSFATWITNMRVRNVAEDISLGIIKAKTDAINGGIATFVLKDGWWRIVLDDVDNNNIYSSKGSWDSKINIEVAPSGANTIMFDNYGFIFNEMDSYLKFRPTTVKTFGVGPITKIRVSSADSKPGVIPVQIVIDGNSVISCLELPANNDSPINCSNIVLD